MHSKITQLNALPPLSLSPSLFSTLPECQFGTQFRELGSTWFADLGPPFGVMYCLRCECVPIHKKRRIVARVQCKNIKNECPKPTCENPILLPGRCCKTCAGDNTSEYIFRPRLIIFVGCVRILVQILNPISLCSQVSSKMYRSQ